MRNQKFISIISIFVILYSLFLHPALAQNMNSTNYNLENSSFNVGGEESSSTNYKSQDSLGDANDAGSSSTNYKVFPGTLQPIYPGVPGTPTLTNTGGTLYNSLDFVVTEGPGNASDVEYAIAISDDDFVTTDYIQTSDTVGGTIAWQTYSGWGSGSGERVTGLKSNTTYKIKVKARFEIDTETIYSTSASATTSNPSISVSFAGVSSSTSVEGQTTTITSTGTTVPFGTLIISTPAVAAQRITVSTNAVNGYTTTIQQNNDLINGSAKTIDGVSGTNASPGTFPGSVSRGAFGYHTSDTSLCTGTTGRFTADDTYAKITTTALEVACNTGVASSEQTDIVYKLLIGALQENGSYTNDVTFITTGTF